MSDLTPFYSTYFTVFLLFKAAGGEPGAEPCGGSHDGDAAPGGAGGLHAQ
jgi:hypothetical protein